MSDRRETDIYVPVDDEGVSYEFHGTDAKDRHDRWALTGEETYDAVVPIGPDADSSK